MFWFQKNNLQAAMGISLGFLEILMSVIGLCIWIKLLNQKFIDKGS